MASRANLKTTLEVLDALGGTAEVAKLLGCSLARVSNWRSFETFPANTFVALTEALARIGKTAPASLWGMVEPSSQHRSAA